MITLLGFVIFCIFILFIYCYPKTGMWVIIFFSIFQLEYLSRWINASRYLVWISFIAAIILFVFTIAKTIVLNERIIFKDTPIKKLYAFAVFLLFLTFFSCLINGVPFIIGIFGSRYILFLLVMTILFYNLRPLELKLETFMRFIVWIGLIQFPFTLLQRLSAGISGNYGADAVSGTFGDYEILAFFQLLSLSIVIFYKIRTGETLIGPNFFLIITVLFLSLLVSNSRASFLFFGVLLLFVLFKYGFRLLKERFSYILVGIFIVVFMYLGVFYVFGSLLGKDLREQYSIEHIIEYTFHKPADSYYHYLETGHEPQMGRFAAPVYAFELIKGNPLTLIFGLGSGNTQNSQFLGQNGQYYEEFGYLSGLSRNQLSISIAEFGLIGVILYILLFFWIWCSIKKKHGQDNSSYQLHKDIFLFLIVHLVLFSVYTKILMNFAVIMIIAYYIAILQDYYLKKKDDGTDSNQVHEDNKRSIGIGV